jgi:hypothetical protein
MQVMMSGGLTTPDAVHAKNAAMPALNSGKTGTWQRR